MEYRRLLRNSPGEDNSGSGRDELHAQLGGFALQVLAGLRPVLVFIVSGAGVNIVALALEHRIDDAGHLAGGSHNSFRRAMLRAHATIESAQGRLRTGDRRLPPCQSRPSVRSTHLCFGGLTKATS